MKLPTTFAFGLIAFAALTATAALEPSVAERDTAELADAAEKASAPQPTPAMAVDPALLSSAQAQGVTALTLVPPQPTTLVVRPTAMKPTHKPSPTTSARRAPTPSPVHELRASCDAVVDDGVLWMNIEGYAWNNTLLNPYNGQRGQGLFDALKACGIFAPWKFRNYGVDSRHFKWTGFEFTATFQMLDGPPICISESIEIAGGPPGVECSRDTDKAF